MIENKDSYNEAELNALLESVTDLVLVGNNEEIYKCNKLANSFFRNNNILDFKNYLPSLGGSIIIKDAETKLQLHFDNLPYNRALNGDSYSINILIEDENSKINRYFHCKGAPIIFENESIGAVLILNEYTYQIAAQDSIKKALNEVDEIKEINKSLEKYSYAIAHDINSPLNNILGLSYTLLDEIGDSIDPEMKFYLESIYNSSKRLNEYVISLLKLSQLNEQAVNKEEFGLVPVLEEIIAIQKEIYSTSNLEITYDQEINMYGDQNLCYAVFQNLISNAIKFSSESQNPKIHIGVELNENNRQIIYVQDNGIGFDQNQSDSLFVPKKRENLASKFSGHGIGLATVQHIINSHGGRIWAKGVKGNGAVFYIYFPSKVDVES